jgi:hypothetical protein
MMFPPSMWYEAKCSTNLLNFAEHQGPSEPSLSEQLNIDSSPSDAFLSLPSNQMHSVSRYVCAQSRCCSTLYWSTVVTLHSDGQIFSLVLFSPRQNASAAAIPWRVAVRRSAMRWKQSKFRLFFAAASCSTAETTPMPRTGPR